MRLAEAEKLLEQWADGRYCVIDCKRCRHTTHGQWETTYSVYIEDTGHHEGRSLEEAMANKARALGEPWERESDTEADQFMADAAV